MNPILGRALLVVAFLPFPLGAAFLLASGCELAVNLNVALDGNVSDVLDCGICADVSADANYDAADVSIYGIQPPDGGAHALDAPSVSDAAPDGDPGRHD
jgi:hypothetical protein